MQIAVILFSSTLLQSVANYLEALIKKHNISRIRYQKKKFSSLLNNEKLT